MKSNVKEKIIFITDEIRQLELDDSRHILYVLFKKGNLQIFDLGNDGQSIQKLTTLLREQIEVYIFILGILHNY